MSVHVSSDVWRYSRAKGATLLVLLSLADQANDEGQCWPKIDLIAERCKVGRRSVIRYLDELRQLGELTWESRQKAGQSNVFTVTVSAEPSARLAPPPSATVGTTPVPTVAPQGTVIEPSLKDSSSTADADDPETDREDVSRLCVLLADLIEQNGSKRPTITKSWRAACRLLLDRDGKTEEQVARAIRWSQADGFWKANILSMGKLREKYDQLRLKAIEQGFRVDGPAKPSAAKMPAELLGDHDAQDRWHEEQHRLAAARKAAQR